MAEKGKEYKHIMRVANTDLVGSKPLYHALRKIKGVGVMFANATCVLAGVDKNKKAGSLNADDIKKLDTFLANPMAHGCPEWLFNRNKDMETGENKHVIGANLAFSKESDVKNMRKMKSYKGVRHAVRLTVRGQKTKSNFRNKKGGKTSLGVKRKKK
jgi:small subunit ribosomal protein S13